MMLNLLTNPLSFRNIFNKLGNRAPSFRLIVESTFFAVRLTEDTRWGGGYLASSLSCPAEIAWPILSRTVRPRTMMNARARNIDMWGIDKRTIRVNLERIEKRNVPEELHGALLDRLCRVIGHW